MPFKKVLSLCEQLGFLRKLTKNKELILKIGPMGFLLLENLRNEWLHSTVTNRDMTVFLTNNNNSFNNTYYFAKELHMDYLPFGIAEILPKSCDDNNVKISKRSDKISFENFFVGEENYLLRCTNFVSPSEMTPFFHQWQRQRRTWWRKFSASPEIYTLTDIRIDAYDNQSVQIRAEYPWGSQLLETIVLHVKSPLNLPSHDLQFKENRRKITAHTVTSTTCLSTMVLNTLCDSYEDALYHGEKKPIFRFHNNMTPYKISFAIASTASTQTDELKQLATYLSKQLKADNISTLFLPSAYKNSLEQQWIYYDQLGIPYNILLNEGTLSNGVAFLRSRDITLKEKVDVTSLQNRVRQLLKNY